ncbi:Lysophospholipase-like protein 1 [Orchesella cincta]|uniref:palmitoyl-protein hydrolase n=1 Tax=Orchesella cincta TaxID=48709 RepID=A0A1D2NBG1_ORCCI|nr:Lysophospholipase-like protein 1 [Orchesella cincta]
MIGSVETSIGRMVVTCALKKKPVKGLVYFLHGACDNGVGLQSWIDKTIKGKFAFSHFPVMYPTSPLKSYTLHEGKEEQIWFDQLSLSPNSPEDWGTISSVGTELSRIIRNGVKQSGIPPENTIIGGFSMGGAMALHLGYRFHSNIAGVFALSSFLPPDSRLFEDMDMQIIMNAPPTNTNDTDGRQDLTAYAKFPKLFMAHGLRDPIVSIRWAKSTFHEFRRRGVEGHFYTIQNSQHTVSKQELGVLHNWIVDTLSHKTKDTEANPETE